MVTRIAHVCLNVRNLDATIGFYERKLGMPVKFLFKKAGKTLGAYFHAGNNTFIEAFQKDDVQVVNTGIVHICLETDDIDTTIAELDQSGVQHSEKKMGSDQSWQTWIKDPDGNALEFHQYTAKSAQIHGGVVEVNW